MREYLAPIVGDREVCRAVEVANALAQHGPGATLTSAWGVPDGPGIPRHRELLADDDGEGRCWTYLASEGLFQETRARSVANAILPIECNLCRRLSLTAVGQLLREMRHEVSVFYMSNLELYMRREGGWKTFVANIDLLPWRRDGVLITLTRSISVVPYRELHRVERSLER